MNFKYFVFFLCVFLYFNTTNAFSDKQLNKLFESATEAYPNPRGRQCLGITREMITNYLSDEAVYVKHGISKPEASHIIESMWPVIMTRTEFKKSITSKLSYEQLVNIYQDVKNNPEEEAIFGFIPYPNQRVTKLKVKNYLLKNLNKYGLTIIDLERIIQPLSKSHMSWKTFINLILLM
ncbi:uncharacterized protein LOC126845862 [Adelges cooleyi]|uniref:uncharacterized protein LOC126845862 n=1 Tax=Adelges cooleyi TaxID=133065 RepID=UPI00217F57E8|nr:uncharacterized protein LOC126845862 [Adelges cooleyi]